MTTYYTFKDHNDYNSIFLFILKLYKFFLYNLKIGANLSLVNFYFSL